MVVTNLPAISDIWVWHENARLPSMCTMQAPHRPVPQPNLVPVSLRSSRITHNNGVVGGASVDAALPFTVKLMAMVSSLRINRASRGREQNRSPFATRFPPGFDLRQRRLDPRRIERQVADTLAGRIGKGVGDGGDRGPLRAFARAERTLVRTVDQLDLDLRRFRHGEDPIACPV